MKKALKVFVGVAALLGVVLVVDRQLHLPPTPPTPAELKALEGRRDELQQRLNELITQAGEKSLARAPRGGVMIGIPTRLASRIVEQVVTGLFKETTLTLRNLHVSKDGEVKVKMLFRKKRVGKFELDVDIHEIQGLLRPGKPQLTFAHEEIGIQMPVAVASGSGSAALHFRWDSKGLAANMVCGDEDITREVTGGVRPEEYHVTGVFGIRSQGESILLQPDFGELAVRIFVVPSEQAWQVVDGVVAEQRGGCRVALEKMNIKGILEKLLAKGFNVKIPKKIFKPLRIPAGVRASLDVQGVKLDLQATPTALLVAEDRLWYGADLRASRGGTPAAK